MLTFSSVDDCQPHKQKQKFVRMIGNSLGTDVLNAMVLIAQFNAKHKAMVPAQM
jgi:hypothetical protein